MEPSFDSVSRQQFRRFFQPSRLVVCVLPDTSDARWNLITVSFNMYCSYKPPMMAIAIQNINRSYELAQNAEQFVLAVPGERLAEDTMRFGWESSRDQDKVAASGVALISSETVAVPGLRDAIANIELVKRSVVTSGDHVILTGEVLKFGVNKSNLEQNLLSVGPDTGGYRVLSKRGIHRIAVIGDPPARSASEDDEEA